MNVVTLGKSLCVLLTGGSSTNGWESGRVPGLVARFGLRRLVPLEPTVAQSRGPAIWGNGPPTAPIAPGERPAGVYDGGPGCYIWVLGAGHGVRTEVRAPGHAIGARQTLTVSPRPEPSRPPE